MLSRLQYSDPESANRFNQMLESRRNPVSRVNVRNIVEDIRQNGDTALVDYTARFDGVTLAPEDLRIDPKEIASAVIDRQTTQAMERAIQRIEAFHCHEPGNDWWTVSADGALLGQRFLPIDSVGVYIPGGSAPYASSLLMNVIPARIAGVSRIVAVTPPGVEGAIDPAILVAARLCGIDEIYRVGGAQAIASLAYGTASIPSVAKIVGPGNAYVAEAKRLVYGDVGIDTIAGPSEVVILADASANPRLIAADLIAQAEHDDDALVLLVTTSEPLVAEIRDEIERQLVSLDRVTTIRAALETSVALLAETMPLAIQQANAIAPEHLQLFVHDPLEIVPKIQTAGVILCGPFSPAAICDYGIGPNHVLPTGGTGRFASALGVQDFLRRISVIHASKSSFGSVAADGIALANIEGLTGHAAALEIRLEDS